MMYGAFPLLLRPLTFATCRFEHCVAAASPYKLRLQRRFQVFSAMKTWRRTRSKIASTTGNSPVRISQRSPRYSRKYKSSSTNGEFKGYLWNKPHVTAQERMFIISPYMHFTVPLHFTLLLEITGFLDFVHLLVFYGTKRFGNLICFRPQVMWWDTSILCWVRWKELISITRPFRIYCSM
jgi:hypothetical protein